MCGVGGDATSGMVMCERSASEHACVCEQRDGETAQ